MGRREVEKEGPSVTWVAQGGSECGESTTTFLGAYTLTFLPRGILISTCERNRGEGRGERGEGRGHTQRYKLFGCKPIDSERMWWRLVRGFSRPPVQYKWGSSEVKRPRE